MEAILEEKLYDNAIEKVFMPLVKTIADTGFAINNLNEARFPSLENAAQQSFAGCNVSIINLPSLLQLLGDFTF